MGNKKTAGYGSWVSPITGDLIGSAGIHPEQLLFADEELYWTERRPLDGGRTVLMRQGSDGCVEEVTMAAFNVRTRVHEYGGGAFTVHRGTAYFSNFDDNGWYRQKPNGEPERIIQDAQTRFADPVIDEARDRMYCVRESHEGLAEAVNTLVAVDLSGSGAVETLADGYDFYGSIRLSPDRGKIMWLCWNHPSMPWDGTELWLADIADDGQLANIRHIAGGPKESIFQPEWSPNGEVYFVSDRSGWWNIYRWDGALAANVWTMEAEFGVPQWVFGMSTYAFLNETTLMCSYTLQGNWQLATIDLVTGTAHQIDMPYSALAQVRGHYPHAAFIGGSATRPVSVVKLNVVTREVSLVRESLPLQIDPGYFSIPEPVDFPTADDLISHAFYYVPANPEYQAPEGEKPPLVVFSHGGPTSATSSIFNLSIQYWTSRGIAVLDVNYGGSTGYGRSYRERLYGNWGIVDVTDCVNGARYLVEQGLVDGQRMAIRGGSAGGYTTLAVLTFTDVFQVGASYYGIGDLEMLARDTHKFESRYMDQLIGPYPAEKERFRERSPIQHADQLSRPVIFLQGLDDKVVPPNQAELMVSELRDKGIPVAYLAFPGEGHGFRDAKNIKRALDAELYFYSRILGFTLKSSGESVEIENL
jgi:dipeptidyl aminopeptidase/acylaminoacyl peptidase